MSDTKTEQILCIFLDMEGKAKFTFIFGGCFISKFMWGDLAFTSWEEFEAAYRASIARYAGIVQVNVERLADFKEAYERALEGRLQAKGDAAGIGQFIDMVVEHHRQERAQDAEAIRKLDSIILTIDKAWHEARSTEAFSCLLRDMVDQAKVATRRQER